MLEITDMPVTDLQPYYQNARRGDVDAIAESLAVNSQYKPIVVNRGTHTGRPFEILAGNHTWMAAQRLGMETLSAVILDVVDAEAARIVAADNKIADRGTYDSQLLFDLLETLDGELEGTGYTDADLDGLFLMLNPDTEEQTAKLSQGKLPTATITFDDEDQLNEWNAFVRFLKQQDGDREHSAAARILDYMSGWRTGRDH